MAESREIRGSKRDSRCPRDFLQRFAWVGESNFPTKLKEERQERERKENVELSLGLSLNGRFGVDPYRVVAENEEDKLVRCSSVSNLVRIPEREIVTASSSLYSPLTRTCSLPAETEELRKRKELQSLRRLEAKRKRAEKLKNVRVVKGKIDENWEGNGKNSMLGSALWPTELKSTPTTPPPQFSSQGSIGSQGSGSSGVSDFESQPPFSGVSKDAEAKSPGSEQSVPQQIERTPSITGPNRCIKSAAAGVASEKSAVKSSNGNGLDHVAIKSVLADMPCVSTKGDGPDGKKIEGFLYRYKKGEQVRIVCVCHGSFMTPAEFVKHGGGGDVEHPLRHIVVNPFVNNE